MKRKLFYNGEIKKQIKTKKVKLQKNNKQIADACLRHMSQLLRHMSQLLHSDRTAAADLLFIYQSWDNSKWLLKKKAALA